MVPPCWIVLAGKSGVSALGGYAAVPQNHAMWWATTRVWARSSAQCADAGLSGEHDPAGRHHLLGGRRRPQAAGPAVRVRPPQLRLLQHDLPRHLLAKSAMIEEMAVPRLSVVVLIYNESESIAPLHEELSGVLEELDLPYEI